MKESKISIDKPLKRIRWFGVKAGLLFFCLSLLMGATMTILIEIASILESVSSIIGRFTNTNTGITAFCLSIVGLLLPTFFYIKGVRSKSTSINRSLVILFLCGIVFLNTALFYKDWLHPNFRMDGQQALGLLVMPFMTSWVYLVLGYVHDVIKENR